MRDILILSEGTPPDHLSGSQNWPGIRINVEAGLSHRDISHRLRSSETPDAVIIDAHAPNAALTDVLASLPCPSVEIQASNPNRHPDGTPNLEAEPIGADAIIYGLGDGGFETALSLLAAQFGGPAA